MTIVICTADNFGGYGDFIFALKLASGLKTELSNRGIYTGDIVLVTEQSGKDKIRKLGGDSEFNIPVLNHEEYQSKIASGELKLDYFIAGPVFNPFLNHPTGLQIPPGTPILLMGEYSIHHAGYGIMQGLKNAIKKTHTTVIHFKLDFTPMLIFMVRQQNLLIVLVFIMNWVFY
jgi:hypothetical protein